MDILDTYDANAQYPCSLLSTCGGFTKLMFLVMHTREYPELHSYIGSYVDMIDIQNDFGWTALMLASRNSSSESTEETVKILLKFGANVNIQDRNMNTALIYASFRSNDGSTYGTVKLLIDYGADPTLVDTNNQNALMLACCYSSTTSNIDTVKLLLTTNMDVNYVSCGKNVLMLTCLSLYSNIETIKLLLTTNIDIHYQNNEGMNVFMLACLYGNFPLIRLLLDAGVDVNATNIDGHNALYYACKNYNVNVELLFHMMEINTKSILSALQHLCHNNLHRQHDNNIRLLAPYTTNITDCFHYCVRTTYQLLLPYCNTMELEQLIVNNLWIKEALYELNKINKMKITHYERVLRKIPEQDAIIRYKPGNMGHKICQFEFDNIITDELLDYLGATPENIKQKAAEYLACTCC